jgi:hypothetical protein
MAVPAMVGAEVAAAMEGVVHLRAQSRTGRPVLGPPSGPARPPRVQGHCGWCGMAATA